MARTESHLLQFFFICAICAICGQILFVCISTSEFGLNDRSQVRLESMLEFQSQLRKQDTPTVAPAVDEGDIGSPPQIGPFVL
jgi:hypothetical protein